MSMEMFTPGFNKGNERPPIAINLKEAVMDEQLNEAIIELLGRSDGNEELIKRFRSDQNDVGVLKEILEQEVRPASSVAVNAEIEHEAAGVNNMWALLKARISKLERGIN